MNKVEYYLVNLSNDLNYKFV